MIKSFHRLFVCKSDEEYASLSAFFRSLGLATGEAWQGRRSKGVKFEVPESGVEIGMGQGFPDADLVIEVDNADIVYQYAKEHQYRVFGEISDCDWGARLFTLTLPQNLGKLAVFSYNEDWRHKNVEAELDATGMSFALVVSR